MVLFLGMSTTVTAILAAGITPFLGATGCILWDRSWLGSQFSLNLFKVCFGAVVFTAFCVYIRLPTYDRFTLMSTSMLAACSFLNIAVGDNLWYKAMKLIGVRRIIMVDTLKPFLAAIMGAMMLKQPFTMIQLIGISLSSVGLLLVAIDRKPKAKVILGANGDAQGAGVFKDSRVGVDITDALKSLHDVGTLSAINADDLDHLDVFGGHNNMGGMGVDMGDMEGVGMGGGGVDVGGLGGGMGMRGGMMGLDIDDDDQLEEGNDHPGDDNYDDFGGDGQPDDITCDDASMHLSMGGRQQQCRNVAAKKDRSKLPYSTLFVGYSYAVINVCLDAVTAVVVVLFGQQFNPWEVCAIRYVTGAVCLISVASGMTWYTCCQGLDFSWFSNLSFRVKNTKQSYINSSASSHSVRDIMPFQSLSALGQYEGHQQQPQQQQQQRRLLGRPGVQMTPINAGPIDAVEEDVESFERYTTPTSKRSPVPVPISPVATSNPLHSLGHTSRTGRGGTAAAAAAAFNDSDSVVSEDILPPRESNYENVTMDRGNNDNNHQNSNTYDHDYDYGHGLQQQQQQHQQQELQWFQCPHMPSDNWQMIILGTFFVTFCCPLLYNYSLFQLNVGLCLTLTSLGPVYSIPLVYLLKGETTTARALLGAFLSVCGVIILCYGQFESHLHSKDNNVLTPNN